MNKMWFYGVASAVLFHEQHHCSFALIALRHHHQHFPHNTKFTKITANNNILIEQVIVSTVEYNCETFTAPLFYTVSASHSKHHTKFAGINIDSSESFIGRPIRTEIVVYWWHRMAAHDKKRKCDKRTCMNQKVLSNGVEFEWLRWWCPQQTKRIQ